MGILSNLCQQLPSSFPPFFLKPFSLNWGFPNPSSFFSLFFLYSSFSLFFHLSNQLSFFLFPFIYMDISGHTLRKKRDLLALLIISFYILISHFFLCKDTGAFSLNTQIYIVFLLYDMSTKITREIQNFQRLL